MIIPSAVFFSDLSSREKLALLTIYSFTSQREDYTTSLSNSVFVKATSMDERTIKKALVELQEKGLISINYPNEYTRTITLNTEALIQRFNIQVEEENEKNVKKIEKTLDKTTQKPYTYMSAEEKKKKEEKEREERRAYSIRLAEERNKNLKNYPYRKREN